MQGKALAQPHFSRFGLYNSGEIPQSQLLLAAELAPLLLVPNAGQRSIPSAPLADEAAHRNGGVGALSIANMSGIIRKRVREQTTQAHT
jgi:hypothetical protein